MGVTQRFRRKFEHTLLIECHRTIKDQFNITLIGSSLSSIRVHTHRPCSQNVPPNFSHSLISPIVGQPIDVSCCDVFTTHVQEISAPCGRTDQPMDLFYCWAIFIQQLQDVYVSELSSYPGYFRSPIDFQWGHRKYPVQLWQVWCFICMMNVKHV